MKITKVEYITDKVIIGCPNCDNWEEMTVNEQRHSTQSFEFLKWVENDLSEAKCSQCESIFLCNWTS